MSISKRLNLTSTDGIFSFEASELKEGSITQVTISAIGCDNRNVSLNMAVKTKEIQSAKASLLCDSYSDGNFIRKL